MFNSHIFYKFIAEYVSKNFLKSVNNWRNDRQEGGLHVGDHE